MNALLNSDEALGLVRDHYALDDIKYCMFIRRGFNDSYLVATRTQKYIFRLYFGAVQDTCKK